MTSPERDNHRLNKPRFVLFIVISDHAFRSSRGSISMPFSGKQLRSYTANVMATRAVSLAALNQNDLGAGLSRRMGGDNARRTGANDHDICVDHLADKILRHVLRNHLPRMTSLRRKSRFGIKGLRG